ncbi:MULTISPECIES: hypothetical protein [Streptomyces]|uniref:Uncharacterized protein n=1 Tax=Streptomyces fradiae ATCC 10745 = DSM 40063 TaxID=1319510 RepID=A0A1Y2NWD3_STRFR|nr:MULTISPECIES: hypothetical protein [Streptomyces]KAF0649222.1 hypothetical protein K701_14035 [Streptomyces fradiae ATCC 10745 = DSM 40063]OSY51852.1 hypothetical protein BG846_02526 [Streptomyces fradiae ATCC 10745 = DSM 40063]QEV12002.1 hypothetical protein CP974_08220 [Streptomyces fradiae ATCC 10745 = DSM 40063]
MTTPAGGRPSIGPKIETRVPADTLTRINSEAARHGIDRARWLRAAAQHGLSCPLTDSESLPLTDALRAIDSHADLREWALTPEASREERNIAAERYAGTLYEMRTMISALRDTLPQQEANDAYVQADATDPEMTRTETARAWARATAAEQLDAVLDALTCLLPVDGESVRARAALDDPTDTRSIDAD